MAALRVFRGNAPDCACAAPNGKEDRVNLRQNTLRWIDLGEVALRGAMPCTLVLDRPQSDGALILFEPQLTAR